MQAGDIILGPIYNADGTMFREGTVVAEIYDDQILSDYKIAKYDLKSTYDEMERNAKLLPTKSVSKKEYDDSVIAYMKAQSAFKTAQYRLTLTKLRTPYTGVILEVMKGANAAAGNDGEVLKIAKMSPMRVKIKFPNEIISLLAKGDSVYVYPSNRVTSVIGWAEVNPSDKRTLYIYVPNEIVPTNPPGEKQKDIRKAYLLFPVIYFHEHSFIAKLGIVSHLNNEDESKILGIPEQAIWHDEKGDYVIRAAGQKAFTEEGSSEEFTAEKVYIKKGKFRKDINVGMYAALTLVDISDQGELKLNDIIIVYGEDGIKSGDRVVFTGAEWMFNIDEELMVKIPAISKEGFYVPENAIIHETDWSNYVYIVENGRAKLVEVTLTGIVDRFYAIKGEGIKEDTKVILLESDNKNDIGQKLYDGMPVSIKETSGLSDRLVNHHTDTLPAYTDDFVYFK